MIEFRKAIGVHHTDTVDRPWDGPANEARLKLDQDESYYRKAYAWQDPDGDPRTKAAYKFIHHEVDSDGNIGPANVRACIAGIAVLNGARGGADIPDTDRPGVYRHLAAHLRDADMEPPELKSARSLIERRAFPLEIRETAPEKRTIVGHAAVFDTITDLGLFKERVARGAFAESIKRDDIRALFNHDPNIVLGRNKAGTLRLREDEKGLAVEIDLPDTQWARDLQVSVERGDINQMSFGFEVLDASWDVVDGEEVRTLKRVKLWDVSLVTFPAYPTTDAGLRSVWEVFEQHRHQHGSSRVDIPDPMRDRQGPEGRQVPINVLRRKLELKIRE